MVACLNELIITAVDDMLGDHDHRQALVDAYQDLFRRVNQTLRIQDGDTARLRVESDEVHALMTDAERVRFKAFFSGESMEY